MQTIQSTLIVAGKSEIFMTRLPLACRWDDNTGLYFVTGPLLHLQGRDIPVDMNSLHLSRIAIYL